MRDILEIYLKPRLLLVALLGFSSGLPLALTASTLFAWLKEAKIDIASIGLFAAVATPYALKFLWSPLVDGARLPLFCTALGQRRGWMLFTQVSLVLLIAAMAFANPAADIWFTARLALLVAIASASQDIVIDAWRVEILPKEEYGPGAAMVTLGYRLGMLASGAGGLLLAGLFSWQFAYLCMAAAMGTGILATLLAQEPAGKKAPRQKKEAAVERVQRFIKESVVAPFADFMTRPHWLTVLLFVVLYKLADAFMGTMFNPFLLDIGFTLQQIAKIVKIYGLAATLAGTFAGGWLVARYGTYPVLMLSGLLHMLTNLLLVGQAGLGPNEHFLTFTVVTENVTGGMSLAAFTAYLSLLCRLNYTATQYALLSSLAALGRTLFSSASGSLVVWFGAWTWLQGWENTFAAWVSVISLPRVTANTMGWAGFFFFASLLALPGLAVLWWLEKKQPAA